MDKKHSRESSSESSSSTRAGASTVKPKAHETRTTRVLSPYNQFMKINVTRFKRETPGMAHKDAFRAAALAWATAPENPKNSKTAAAKPKNDKPIKMKHVDKASKVRRTDSLPTTKKTVTPEDAMDVESKSPSSITVPERVSSTTAQSTKAEHKPPKRMFNLESLLSKPLDKPLRGSAGSHHLWERREARVPPKKEMVKGRVYAATAAAAAAAAASASAASAAAAAAPSGAGGTPEKPRVPVDAAS